MSVYKKLSWFGHIASFGGDLYSTKILLPPVILIFGCSYPSSTTSLGHRPFLAAFFLAPEQLGDPPAIPLDALLVPKAWGVDLTFGRFRWKPYVFPSVWELLIFSFDLSLVHTSVRFRTSLCLDVGEILRKSHKPCLLKFFAYTSCSKPHHQTPVTPHLLHQTQASLRALHLL